MIIDAHVQFGPGLRTDSPFQPAVSATTAEEIIALLDRTGIDRALVGAPRWVGGRRGQDFIDPNYTHGNAAIAEGTRAYPDRLIGAARVNPKFGSQAVAELQTCLDDYGFRGLHLDNESEAFNYQDLKLLAPLLEICDARHVPVLVHTWVTPSQPVQLILLARAFPSVNFIMLNSGWRLTIDAMIAAKHAPNLFFETSHAGSALARDSAKAFGIERVVFGSAAPFAMPEVELERVRRWGGLNPTDLGLVLGGNIARLTGLAA